MNISILKKIYHRLPQPDNWKFWVLIAFIVKSLFVIYFFSFVYSYDDNFSGFNWEGSIAKAGGDAPSYFEPIENLINNGQYLDDYRMPGYGWIYYLLRWVFSKTISFNIIIIIQLIFSAISVYLLGKIAHIVFEIKKSFYITYFLYLTSTYVSIFDYVLMTESLTVSTIIISLYLFFCHIRSKSFIHLFFSGLFITWAIFLRPIVAPILLLYLIFLIYFFVKEGLLKKLSVIFIFLCSFIIIDGFWIARNYRIYQKLIPLQKDRDFKSVVNGYGIHMRDFIRSFGGNAEFWLPNSESLYFTPESDYFIKAYEEDTLLSLIPHYIYTKDFNIDSLNRIREQIVKIYDPKTKASEVKDTENEIIVKFDNYQNSIKKEKPFLYYVFSRLISLKRIFINTDYNFGFIGYYFSPKHSVLFTIFSKFYIFFYYIVMIFGIIGFFMLITNKNSYKNKKILLFIFLFFYFNTCYSLIFKENQSRYLTTAYPFLILSCQYFFFKLYHILKINIPEINYYFTHKVQNFIHFKIKK
ncbi:MAG: hypothetical protein PHT69_14790 [Bacteroidales bacterium]|nr:hypothetical protein [Bacteroidales bacterium]